MTNPWELDDPVPEDSADRFRQQRRSLMTSIIALLVVLGLVGTTVISLF